MAVAKKPEKLIIGNTTIEIGKKYLIDNKFDASAPDGMKAIKATKFPMRENDTLGCVYYDEISNQYDTGLYDYSRCLNRLLPEQARERVAIYKKHIKTPFENLRNVDLEPKANNDFWKNYRYTIFANKEFDTNNVSDLFDLFNALMQGDICNEDERDPMYRQNAMFTITNPAEVKDRSKNNSKKRMQTMIIFNEMVDANREKVDNILSYINRGNSSKIEDEELKLIYFDVIKHEKTGIDFVDRFTEACEKYETPNGELEMEYFSMVQLLLTKNLIKKVGSKYTTINDNVFLGNSPQDIAKFCINKESEQHKIISELVDKLN
jgi:hypothetical protein